MRSALALAVMAGVAPLAIGQVAKPRFYVWNQGGVPYAGSNQSPIYITGVKDLKPIIRDYNVKFDTVTGAAITDPKFAARKVAREVIFRTQFSGPNHLRVDDSEGEGEVVISFYTFGRDDISYGFRPGDDARELPPTSGMDCDSAAARAYSGIVDVNGSTETPTEVDGPFVDSQLRFFTEADRLPLPQDPNNEAPDFSFNFPTGSERLLGRTYRNPVMLKNANPDPNNFPPLKQWMDDFCKEYVAIQQDLNHPARLPLQGSDVFNPHDDDDFTGLTLPPPNRFHLDNETHDSMSYRLSKNDLWMLYTLAKSKDLYPTNSLYNYWNNDTLYKVPGTGKTLQQLYAEAVTAHSGLPGDILDDVAGLQQTLAPDADANRPFMLWYADVCRQARNAVMTNCYYGVVKNYWQNCKVSNYDDGKTDGVVDKTGWFMDTPGTKVDNTYPTRQANNQLPRGWTSNNENLAGRYWDEINGTWDVHRTYCSADMSSPVTYKIGTGDHLGHAGNPGYGDHEETDGSGTFLVPNKGAQQPNLYIRMLSSNEQEWLTVPETADETTLRLVRHRLESCMKSNNEVHKTEIVPWVAMAHEERQSPKYARDLMAMLRSHKVPEIIVFSGRNLDINTPEQRGAAATNWRDTQPLIDQVYSPYIWDFGINHGVIPVPNNWANDPARLEYTFDNLPSVDILSKENQPDPEGPELNQITSLEMEIRGFVNPDTSKGYFSTFGPETVEPGINYGYTLYLECSLKPVSPPTGGYYGTVEVFNWTTQNWVHVSVVDSTQDELHQDRGPRMAHSHGGAYQFWTEDENGNRQVRIAIDIRSAVNNAGVPIQNFVSTATTYLNPVTNQSYSVARGAMRIRLNHVANSHDDTFISSYDLVQVVPFPCRSSTTVGGQPAGQQGSIIFGASESELVPGPGGIGLREKNIQTEYAFGPVDLGAFPHAPEYYSNPSVKRFGNMNSIWEPSLLDDKTCTPVHYFDWNYHVEGPTNLNHLGQWPTGYNANAEIIPNTRIVTSRFNLAADQLDTQGNVIARKQRAVARFTIPVWTDAPEEAATEVQPYQVWYWINRNLRWANVTEGVDVQISRDPIELNREVVVSSRATGPFQAGYYALTLNVTPPDGVPTVALNPDAQQQYAVYCSGTPEEPGALIRSNTTFLKYDETLEDYVIVPVLQYNFRIYPDCNNNGLIDADEAQCNYYNGTDCPADVDDGSGTNTPDQGVDIDDLLYFLVQFEGGFAPADLDNGTGVGIPDGGVDINDLLFFLAHFELGC
jgi:hypothetical protein